MRTYRNYGKYGNRKICVDGITFDSKKEAMRYCELKTLEAAGQIKDLQLQKEYELIPAQYEQISRSEYIKHNGHKTKGKCLERAVKYKADFVYIDLATGAIVVEDTKGMRTKEYIIKRKLMLYQHGIRVKEV